MTCVTLNKGDIIIFSAVQYHCGAAYPAEIYPIGNIRYHCYLDGKVTQEYRKRSKSNSKKHVVDKFAVVYNACLEGNLWVEGKRAKQAKQAEGFLADSKLAPPPIVDLPDSPKKAAKKAAKKPRKR